MRAGLLTALVAVLALGIASPTDTTAHRSPEAKRPSTVLALRPVSRRGLELVRLDRRSLQPASKRRVLDLDGDQRFHLFGARAVHVLERLDERVFVDDGATTHAVNARMGRILRAPRELPQLLAGTMSRY